MYALAPSAYAGRDIPLGGSRSARMVIEVLSVDSAVLLKKAGKKLGLYYKDAKPESYLEF